MGKPPKLHIIYDSRRIEKYEPLIKELKRQGIKDYEIYPCLMYNDVVSSINLSHKMLVREAMNRGDEMVVIAEDDLMFCSSDGWRYYLENMPAEFDIYLGGTYILPISNNMICGFHLYAVHQNFYARFLSIPDNVHIDTHMNELKGDYKFCYPLAAIQRAGFSSNNKMNVNYNAILQEQDVYGGLPR